jgi:hypothetical protein
MWHSFGKRRPHDQSASLFSKASLIHTRHWFWILDLHFLR